LSWPGREVVRREASKITAAEMTARFEDLEKRHPMATAVNIVVDNATYNRAAAVREWLARERGGRVGRDSISASISESSAVGFRYVPLLGRRAGRA